MRPDTLLIDRSPGETRLALLARDTVVQLLFERDHLPDPVEGAVFAGRVTALNPDMNAAFVDIGTEPPGFLGFNDARADLETKAKSIKHLLIEGERVLVQADRSALEGKGPRLTRRLRLQGRFLSLKRGEDGLKYPRIMARAERDRLAPLHDLLPLGLGVELSPAAGGAEFEALEADLMDLLEENAGLEEAAGEAKAGSVLIPAPSILDQALAMSAPDLRIIVNRTGVLPDAFDGWAEVWAEKTQLFDAFGVEDAIDDALSDEVSVPGGGRLIIRETPALTAIDVDTAKAQGHTPAKLAKAVNGAAVKTVFQALRLRNLGGQILVDLLPMRSKKDRQDLLTQARQLAGSDVGDVHVLGFSALGLLEITRRRTGPSLLHQVTETAAGGFGGGRILSGETVALAGLRAVEREGGATPGLSLRPDALKQLKGALKPALEEAEERLGATVTLTELNEPLTEGYRLS